MPVRIVRSGRLPDSQVLLLFETVMRRWPTNNPLMAVGGFSYSYPSDEWLKAVRSADTFLVTSATVSERDAAFSLHFRRGRDDAMPDEIQLSWGDPGARQAHFPAEDAQSLAALVEAAAGLPPKPALLP